MSDTIINSRLDAEEDSKRILSAAETLQNREIQEDCSSNLTVQRESVSAYNLSQEKKSDYKAALQQDGKNIGTLGSTFGELDACIAEMLSNCF